MADIRWRQRLQNFRKAHAKLAAAFARGSKALSELEKEGAIQRFEYTLELAWKTLKDYLEENGVQLEKVTPKHVIKEAFAARVVPNGQLWIDMIERRNQLSHQYDEEFLDPVITEIEDSFLPALSSLLAFFERQP